MAKTKDQIKKDLDKLGIEYPAKATKAQLEELAGQEPQALQVPAVQDPNVMTKERVELITNTVAKGATPDELKLFLLVCQRTGLDPFTRQIYYIKRFDTKTGQHVGTIQTGIDGFRANAEKTGEYAGSDEPIFEESKDAKTPTKATVTVYRIVQGQRVSFTASARWDEYYPGDKQGFMWRKMPETMLGKCAEALALRKAFPQNLSGVYVHEEMEQADKNRVKVTASVENGGDPFEKAKKLIEQEDDVFTLEDWATKIKASKLYSKGQKATLTKQINERIKNQTNAGDES